MIKSTNRHLSLALILIAALGTLLASTFALSHGQKHNPARHHYMMRSGVPAGYEGRVNPLEATKENLLRGKTLYAENCVSCHGANGKSHTDLAKDLDPPPAVLAGMYDRAMTGMGSMGAGGHMMHGMMHHHPGMSHAEAMGELNLDAYNFWAVSEGGTRFGSAMPAFKDVLDERELWLILLHVASSFSDKRGG